jgi:subtilisin family serine protease
VLRIPFGLLTSAAVALGVSLAPVPALADAPILPAEGTRVDNEYIVVFENAFEAPTMMDRMERWSGGRMMRRFELVLPGGLFRMTPAQARRGAQMPGVAFIEENAVVQLDATQANPPTYGLDRIDQRALPLSRGYGFDFTGAGVNVYVIDSGIRTSHVDFGGRAAFAANFVNDGRTDDCNGHGTHVAGTAGSSTFGVAKGARLFAVRVFGCTGSSTNGIIIAGVDFVARNGLRPAVANMSLGGGASTALDTAVNNAVAAGVFVAVAAGNSNVNACNVSPARAQRAFTVAASDSADARASFSNFGACVEIFAPGVGIPSLSFRNDTDSRLLSGTSMSSPHVAGAAALVLQQLPTRTPAEVGQTLLALATPGVIRNGGTGTPNRLLFTPRGVAAPAPAGPIVSASFDADAQGFAFLANAFRATNSAAFAAGEFDAASGASGGGLVIVLGGRDNTVVNGMSGGFVRTFTVPAATTLTARLRVMVTQSPNYEADEFSDALLSIDGRLVGTGGNDFLARVFGDGNGGAPISTGWRSITVPLGQVAAGTHTLRIGGFNSKKTLADELTGISIDDVQIGAP